MSQFFGSLGRGFRGPKNKKPPALPQNPEGSSSSKHDGNGGYVPGPASAGLKPSSPLTAKMAPKPLFLCKPFVTSQLVKGSFSTIVVLPKYVDQGEWLALNLFEFFDMLNKFYGVVQEFCTPRNCPSMSAGPGYDNFYFEQCCPREKAKNHQAYCKKKSSKTALKYPHAYECLLFPYYNQHTLQYRFLLADSDFYHEPMRSLDYSWLDANKKPLRLPAPTYIEYVLQWISNRINDESIFPTKQATGTISAVPSVLPGPSSPAGPAGANPAGNWIGKEGGFPQNFHATCKAIYKQMFRVFDMLERRDIEPLRSLIEAFEEQGLFKDSERSREQS
ncbi:Maintenance of ploidy protein mob2 [Rhizina undulata]